jgi:hypothetical protein
MTDRPLQLELVLGPRGVIAAAACALLLSTAAELSSESVQMSTYYPAPSATYGNLITMSQTYLARDSGGVTVGSNGTTAGRLSVMNGAMGIGTSNPLMELDVEGRATFGAINGYTSARGLSWHVQSGYSNGNLNYAIAREQGSWNGVATAQNPWGYPNLAIDFHTGVRLKGGSDYGGVQIWDDICDSGVKNCNVNWTGAGSQIAVFRANFAGGSYIISNTGAQTTAPIAPLDIGGSGLMVVRQAAASCYQKAYALNSGASCLAGEFITQQSGLMSRYAAGTTGGSGIALCCKCPTISGAFTCPSLP